MRSERQDGGLIAQRLRDEAIAQRFQVSEADGVLTLRPSAAKLASMVVFGGWDAKKSFKDFHVFNFGISFAVLVLC